MSKIVEELCEKRENNRVQETREETARTMLSKGKYSIEEIAEINELSVEEVKALADSISSQ